MTRIYLVLIGLLCGTNLLFAQDNKSKQKQLHSMDMHHHSEMKVKNQAEMMSDKQPSFDRIGSGTGWLPDSAKRHGYMWHSEKWMFMLHGNVFLRYTKQDIAENGIRGGEKFGATNWLMGMSQTKIGKNGLLRFSAMLSFEALTVGGAGYPLLFQSGETWNGTPLVDHQHPHDLFSELSVSYKHAFSKDISAFVYLGYPGEPALGPVAFMHRPSGIYNSNTPLGHHWQDATHVTFGVATLGFQYKNFKIEGSVFTGTEPDENRYNFDKPKFNSQSIRLSYNPSKNWAFQVSQAWLNDVHSLGLEENMNRTTASAIHSIKLGKNELNSTLVWGRNNNISGHHPSSNSFLIESAFDFNKTSLYGRYEWVEKSSEDLVLDETIYGHGKLFDIHAITLGIQQKLLTKWHTNFSAGLQGRLYLTPNSLENLYGETPLGIQVYLRIYPWEM